MAVYDVTITDPEYNQMMLVLDAMRAKLAPLKAPLARMLQSQPAKVKAFMQSEDGRFLREVWRIYRDLGAFAEALLYQGAD
jgi:hypothetical protein